jgi:two-component system, cell cycle sensor histidine kinase and response regulator CckA
MGRAASFSARRIAGIYTLLGALWIIVSDRLLAMLVREPHTLTLIQTYKGWAFVLASGSLIFLLLNHELRARTAAQEALRESEAKYRSLFNNVEVGMFRTRLDGSEILDMNEKFLKIFDRSREEMRGNPSLIHWADPRDREEMLRRLSTDGRVTDFECKMFNKQGEARICITSLRLYHERGILEGSIIDITERKKTEKALRLSQAELASIFNSISDAVVFTDKERKILRVNPAFTSIWGYEPEEAIGRTTEFLYVDKESYQEEGTRRYNVNEGTEPPLFVKSWRRKDGTMFPAESIGVQVKDSVGNIIGFLGVHRDITERKNREEDLDTERSRFKSLAENSPFGMAMISKRGQFQYVNRNFTKMFGYDLSDIPTGREWFRKAFPDEEYRHGVIAAWLEDLAELGIAEQRPRIFSVTCKGGEERIVHFRPVQMETGEHLMTCEDISARIGAERELAEHVSLLEAILEKAADGICVGYDSPEPPYVRFTHWNPRMEEITGYTKAEINQSGWYQTMYPDPDMQRKVRERMSRMREGDDVRAEERIVTKKDGTKMQLSISSSVLKEENGQTHVLALMQDITQRKQVQEALQESEERFRLTFQTSPDSININRLSDGLYLDVNDGFTAITGYSREEVIGKSSLELEIWHTPQDRQRLVESLKQTGYVSNLEAKFRFKDGTVITGLMSARVIMLKGEPHIVSITRNIEEWRRTQEALRESERRYRTLFEESIDGVYSVLREGEITDANTSFCKLFGYTRKEMIGKDIRELYIDPADRPKFQEEIEKNGFVKDYEVKFRKSDGTEIDCLLTSSVHFGQDGSIVGYRGILRDLTSRKALQKQLLQAQKMEAIGTLAGGMAHDFNNLLQAILGYSDLLIMKKGPGDPDRKKLEVIQHAARDGADLVSRILTFSRRVESRTRPIDLNEEIRKAQKLLRRTVPRMIEIKLVLAEALAIIDADPAQVEQVLLNLVVNAQHAMPNGGQLLIETRNVSLSDEYLQTHLGAKPGHYVLLTVSDNGVGIEYDVLDRIFEPFFTTKTDGEGTGLGLSMVHGIISQHGGYIRCYSEPGMGTSFKIYFPVSAGELISDLTLTREMPAFGTETVLLVDDDDRIRELGRQMIEMGGYQVIVARSGEEALKMYPLHREEISLIILDLIMPGMGGRRCLEELLRIDPNVRVLVATGYSPNAVGQVETGRGARGFISKPYDAKDILGAIRTVLDKGHL